MYVIGNESVTSIIFVVRMMPTSQVGHYWNAVEAVHEQSHSVTDSISPTLFGLLLRTCVVMPCLLLEWKEHF